MEEKKNNQAQAMEDESLENVSGGWNAVIGTYIQHDFRNRDRTGIDYGLRTEYLSGFDFSPEEVLKLVKAGVNVQRKDNGSYDCSTIDANKIKSILGTEKTANRYL